VLIHLVDGTEEDVAAAYRTIRGELSAYSPLLAEKPELVALNKCDAIEADDIKKKAKALSREAGRPVHQISGATGKGVRELLFAALGIIREARAAEAPRDAEQEAEGTEEADAALASEERA
jgi:GTP-binding protein